MDLEAFIQRNLEEAKNSIIQTASTSQKEEMVSWASRWKEDGIRPALFPNIINSKDLGYSHNVDVFLLFTHTFYSQTESALIEKNYGEALENLLKTFNFLGKIEGLAQEKKRLKEEKEAKKHGETRGMKRDVFAFCEQYDMHKTSAAEISRGICASKLVALKERTVHQYVLEYKKKHRQLEEAMPMFKNALMELCGALTGDSTTDVQLPSDVEAELAAALDLIKEEIYRAP